MVLVRFLNSTVMVRVGGGWVTLQKFLESHDPCKGMFSNSVKIFCHNVEVALVSV